MKFLSLLPRILLGLGFTIFGSNGFLHFLKMKEDGSPIAAATFGHLLFTTHYFAFVFACQLVGGILLLLGKAPLGLVFLGPVLVNIVLYHVLFGAPGLSIALVFVALFAVVFWQNRKSFEPIFKD